MKNNDKLELEKERQLYFNRTTSEAIWEWDITNGDIYRNKQLQKLTGFSQDYAKDLSWWFNRIHQRDRDRVQLSVSEALEQKKASWEEEYLFQCADGIYKVMHDRGFVVYENGAPVRMIGSLQDVTELAQLKEQLAEEKQFYQKEIAESIIDAQEKERTNLGNELHDNVNQILTTARLYLDMMNPSTAEDKDIKDKTKELISMAYDEIRKLSKDLVSPQLKSESIVQIIQELVDEISASGKFKVSFKHQPAIWVSRNLKTTIFRIVQEQLKNIVRYSEATEVLIDLKSEITGITLSVSDNGKGFDPSSTRNGIGLININERVKLYNGTVNLDSAPGKGCSLQVKIPV
jgi:PAS domain S-box-containing protein